MNILFIQRANTIGGAELSLLETISYLSEKGHKCYVLLNKSHENLLGKHLEKVAEKVFLIPIKPWRYKKNSSIIGLLVYKIHLLIKYGFQGRVIKRLLHDFKELKLDLIHSNTVHTDLGFLIADELKVPSVLHLREITGLSKESIVTLPGQKEPDKFKKRYTFDGLIANSHYCLRLNRPYFKGRKEQVIYNPVLMPKQVTSNMPKQRFKVILVANITSRIKRHVDFINLAEAYVRIYGEEIDFCLYGKIPPSGDEYLQKLEELVENKGLCNCVLFKGSQPVSDIYSNADVLIHAFPFETFGRIFIEAMLTGVPILAAKGGGAEELITDGVNGMFLADSVENQVEQLRSLLYNKCIRDKLISNGLTFSKKFSPEVVLKDLEPFYKSLLIS